MVYTFINHVECWFQRLWICLVAEHPCDTVSSVGTRNGLSQPCIPCGKPIVTGI